MVFEDRVAKYPGRWTMVKSDGTSEVVTLVRNDEPTVKGTPINADTLNELSTVAGAINAKEESISAAQIAASERAKAEQAATNAANAVKANLKEYSDKAATSASNAAESEKNAKASATVAQEHQTGAEAAQKKAEDAADRAAAIVSTDKTLTVENAPADAKAVGEALKNLNIRPATSTTLGGIKVGSRLSVTEDGTLNADDQGYTLPVATTTVLGGVKVGDNLSIDSDGTVSLTGENVTKALTYTPAPKDEVTQVTPGLMSAADKKKLDGLDSTGAIAASGNGYIRFSDGTQICWNTAKLSSSRGNYVFTFPVPFINTTYAVAGFKADRISDTNYNNFCYYTKKTGQVEIDDAYNGYNDNLYSTLVVIGRWK